MLASKDASTTNRLSVAETPGMIRVHIHVYEVDDIVELVVAHQPWVLHQVPPQSLECFHTHLGGLSHEVRLTWSTDALRCENPRGEFL